MNHLFYLLDFKGGWSVPGAISAAPVQAPLPTYSPANPLGSTSTSAPTALSSNALLPIVYWYGHAEIKKNPLLIDRLIRNLGENVQEKCDIDVEGRKFGFRPDSHRLPSFFKVAHRG